jgi:hypothetical protein
MTRRFQIPQKKRIPLDTDTVRKMLSDLCETFYEFNEFYTENKSNIERLSIKWYIDRSKKKGEGSADPITDEIVVYDYPKSIEDSHLIAHEIEHFLIWNEGFPYIMVGLHEKKSVHLEGKKITEIIFEPLVEMRLKKYFGFLSEYHQRKAIEGLEKIKRDVDNGFIRINSCPILLYYSCVYLKRRLLIEATGENTDSNEYIRLVNDAFGNSIVPCAEKLLKIIRLNSPITPSSVKLILDQIFHCKKIGLTYREETLFNRLVIQSRPSL